MLHWVGNEMQDEETEVFRVTIEQFIRLLQWLNTRHVIRLEDWESIDNFYALTIDDAPENFYQNAYPLLKEAKVPFTIFVNVSLLDKDGFISTAQLKEMASCELCTVGSHGVLHDEYQKFNASEALKDLNDSKAKLENIIGKPVELYAFPYGSYYACGYMNKHLVTDVYKYGFSTVKCAIINSIVIKKYFLPRINADVKFINSL